MALDRNPGEASHESYDLIVVGGGMYGVMTAFEAVRRNLKVLLLEKKDFGGATSFNSLRIVHGGLRYLQSLNIQRYREFVGERRWFLKHFPDLVHPLPVLMPLYQQGVRRTSMLRAAFWLDRHLSRRRNRELPVNRWLPAGKIVDPTDVEHLFPAVEGRGLAGGALWYDACVPDSQSMIMSVLRSTCQLGADALNYMPVVSMIKDRHRITGVRARDEIEGREYAFSSPRVINTTGPWVRDIARLFDRDLPSLFQYSIGWNILFDRESLSTHALAVSPPAPGSRLYFFHPWKGRLLVGTGHAPRESREENPHPTEEEIRQFLDDLNAAVPRMNLGRDDILHVFAGLIPVDQPGTLQFTKQDRIVEHARHGGPEGLFSMAGTKLTTGRSGAAAMIQHVFPNRPVSLSAEQALLNPESFEYALAPEQAALDYRWMPDENEPGWKNALQRIIQKEAVLHLDDLVLRRTTLGDNPVRALTLAPSLSMLFDWDADRRQVEIRRLEHHFQWIPNPATT